MSLTVRRALMTVVVVAFLAYTALALVDDGWGFFTRPFTDSTSGSLIVTDLLIELTLLSIAIHYDSRRRGRNPWAWIVITMTLGAVGSVGYLLARSFDQTAPPLVTRSDAKGTAAGRASDQTTA
jgi:RsiW-degrading membrane proteinase PrsW (M82 family)